MTADVRRVLRRGTPSACATKHMHPEIHESYRVSLGTRPSLGPEARARQSSLHTKARAAVVRRTREHHGWATLGNQRQPSLGLSRTDGARLAACHRFRKGEGVTWSRKGRRSRPPSLRGSELGFGCPHSDHVAEVGRRQRSRIGSANALQKERRVE